MLRGFFPGVVKWCFCRGFLEKRAFLRGFLMVNSWWNCGELWFVDGRFFVAENFSLFSTLFSTRPCCRLPGTALDPSLLAKDCA
jgi:hypothetical protein